MKQNEIINKIIEQQSLDVFKVGCDRKNFEILKDILKRKDMSIDDIMTKYGMSLMPANRRINLMSKAGLVKRIDRKRKIIATPLGQRLPNMISEIRKYLKNNIRNHFGELT